ncbi:MAG: multidrug ABC transporter permease [Deltaproteobacteria bacterium]|nr:MAG: multidrug ABC transporter permease [Deltaproteobacteria bacterium]
MATAPKTPRLGALIGEELRLLLYDRWLLFAVTCLPAGLFFFIFFLFQQGIVRDLPVAVVDMDNSQLSRSLIRAYDASCNLHLQNYPSLEEAAQALRRTEVYGIITIPAQLEQHLRTGLSPQVTAFYNFQSILVGKVLKSAIATAHATFNAQLATLQGLARGNVQLIQAQGTAVTTRKQITPLYNIGSNYAQFLVTGLLPTIWQILMVAVTVLVWAAEERRTGIANWLQERAVTKMIVRLGWYQVIFLLQGFSFLALFVWQGWPARGDLGLLLLAQWLTVFACQGVATLFILVIPVAPRALSMATAYTAPSFAFLGVTFPVTDMEPFARFWRSLLPISHYMEIQIGIMNYGVSFVTLWPSFWALLCFFPIFLAIAAIMYVKKNSSTPCLLPETPTAPAGESQ